MSFLTTKKQSMHTCTECFDAYYVTKPKGDYAIARRCEHCAATCEVCYGEGFTLVQRKDGYQILVNCTECTNLDKRLRRFDEARIPARYFDKSFGTVFAHHPALPGESLGNVSEIRASLSNYAMAFTSEQKGVLIGGKVGTGKTHMMVAFARHLTLEKGFQCRFIEFTHLLSDLREAYETRQNAAEILNRLSAVPILFIDELGKGRKNDWQLGVIDELISKRYNSCLPTFFTTNYPLTAPQQVSLEPSINTEKAKFARNLARESLGSRVGERIVSRLTEMCLIATINDETPDYRELQRMSQERELQNFAGPETPIR